MPPSCKTAVKILMVFLLPAFSETQVVNVRDKLIFPVVPNSVDGAKNSVCAYESELYTSHLDNLTLWAYEMWEASAQSTTGILRGSIFQMGDWDECLSVTGPITTQYCLVTLKASIRNQSYDRDPISLYYSPYDTVLDRLYDHKDVSQQTRHVVQVGLCVPGGCPISDLENSANSYLSSLSHPYMDQNLTYAAAVTPSLCQSTKERTTFDHLDIAFCFLVIVLVVLLVSSTIYDFSKDTIEEKPSEKKTRSPMGHTIFLAFSARKNFSDLPRADESNPALSVLYGMKTFAICMIIMDHRFGTFLSGPVMNFDYIEKEYRANTAWFIFHGDLFVDTFFTLSGILATYGLLAQFDKKLIGPLFIIFMRYIRLTPVYAFVIFYYATLFYHIGSGPLWNLIIQPEVEDCRDNWWTNLLYVNNYVNAKHMCLVHAWYLPCDFHYFIIAIFVTTLIKKRKIAGLGVLTGLSIVSIIIPFAITVVYMRPALLQFYTDFLTAPKSHPDFQLTYSKTHTRATAYFVGMFVGYFYYRLKGKTHHMSRKLSHLAILLSILLLLGSMAFGAIFYNRYYQYNVIESGAYAALHRIPWSLGTSGLLLTGSYGDVPLLKSVLSWSPWIPLSKLVYGAYLAHMNFQLRVVAMTTTPRYFTYFDTICLALGDIVLAFFAALLLYLAIEAPVRKIFKELLVSARTPSAVPEKTSDNRNGNETMISHREQDSRL